MKKIISLLLIIISLITLFVSCDSDFKDVTYKEDGITFTLPNTMRKSSMEGYDFYFTNTAVNFAGKKIDEEFCEILSLKNDISAKEYIDYFTAERELPLEELNYKYDEQRKIHNFVYSQKPDEITLVYYAVVTGEPGNVWIIDMWCEEEYYENNLNSFGEWKRSISAYG